MRGILLVHLLFHRSTNSRLCLMVHDHPTLALSFFSSSHQPLVEVVHPQRYVEVGAKRLVRGLPSVLLPEVLRRVLFRKKSDRKKLFASVRIEENQET